MNPTVSRNYRAWRSKGYGAAESMRAARTEALWDRLEALDMVRLRNEPDESPDTSFWDEAERESAERDGVWGIVTSFNVSGESCEYHCDDCTHGKCRNHDWEVADSCWGFVGAYAWDRFNDYRIDLMQSAIRELRDALRDRVRESRSTIVRAGMVA